MIAIAFIAACLVASVTAELGACPTPKVHPDFELEKLVGTWYEIEASPSIDRATKKCSRWIFENKEKNKAGLLQKFIAPLSSKVRSEYADVTTPKTSEPAKLLIAPVKGTLLGKKYSISIIDTDYESYAIVFSCTKLVFTHHQDVVILSREKKMDDKKKMEIYGTLSSRDINQKNLVSVDQSDDDCSKLD